MRFKTRTLRMRTSVKRLKSERYKGIPIHFVHVGVRIDSHDAMRVGAVIPNGTKVIAKDKPSAYAKMKKIINWRYKK